MDVAKLTRWYDVARTEPTNPGRPMQGYSRVLYGLMIPEGREASYFAIYQVMKSQAMSVAGFEKGTGRTQLVAVCSRGAAPSLTVVPGHIFCLLRLTDALSNHPDYRQGFLVCGAPDRVSYYAGGLSYNDS